MNSLYPECHTHIPYGRNDDEEEEGGGVGEGSLMRGSRLGGGETC